ncbi:GAF domain-containing protein [Saccharomonospora sp. CUA-673]|uniref:GAF domain-containing protein n=1 Tax=Saccharomonospora sp. CUA-673 TaxID=1904969 RepID=UPI000B27AC82
MAVEPARDAVLTTSDPLELQHALKRLRDATLGGERSPDAPRTVISESWQRSLAAKVDPDDYRPPEVYDFDEVSQVRADHPLHAVLTPLRELLVSISDESQHITIVTDADGTILWREGPSALCGVADHVGLREGTRWSEQAIGTNAMGTALAVDAPVQIYSAEHLVRTYHSWTCAAAPIHDPDTDRVLGAIDISGRLDTLHPAMVSLVNATAQVAENHLRIRMEQQDERMRARNMRHLERLGGESAALLAPSGRVIAANPIGGFPRRIDLDDPTASPPDSDRVDVGGREALLEPLAGGYLLRFARSSAPRRRPAVTLSLLGSAPEASLDGRVIPLTLRRAEILALLVLHPGGLTATSSRCICTATTATRPRSAPRCTGSGPSSAERCWPSRTDWRPISTPTSCAYGMRSQRATSSARPRPPPPRCCPARSRPRSGPSAISRPPRCARPCSTVETRTRCGHWRRPNPAGTTSRCSNSSVACCPTRTRAGRSSTLG